MFKLKVEMQKKVDQSEKDKMCGDLATFIKEKGSDVGSDIRKLLKLEPWPRDLEDGDGTKQSEGGERTTKKTRERTNKGGGDGDPAANEQTNKQTKQGGGDGDPAAKRRRIKGKGKGKDRDEPVDAA